MSRHLKKRKTTEDMELEADYSLIDAAVSMISKLNLYDGVSQYSDLLGNNDKTGYGLLYGQYSGDGFSLNSNVVHDSLLKFTVIRDAKGAVEAIHDSKTKIVGMKLQKLMIATYAIQNGITEMIITENDDDGVLEVLFLPAGLNVEDAPSPSTETKKKPVNLVHHYKGKTLVFFTIAELKTLLSINYIDLKSMKKVLNAFNNLKEANGEYKLNPKEVDTLAKLQAVMLSSDGRTLSNFYGSLVSANVSQSSISEKVYAFVAVPSKTFARTLGLCKPYSQQVIERGTLNKIQKVKLSELDPDDNVLMSSVPIDDKFYDSLISDPEEYMVFKSDANVGLTKNKKWVPMSGHTTYSAKDLVTLLTSIVESNGGKATKGKPKDDGMSELKDLEEAEF